MRTIIFTLFTFLFFSNVSAQTIGEIFTKEYADKEFGEVLDSVEIKNDELLRIISKSEDYVMFNIETEKVRILDEERNSILGEAESNEEVFYKTSISQIKILLDKGKNETTFIEIRQKTLTITNGNFTLEKSLPCPPLCD